MSEEICILNGGVQTVAPLAAPQVVYLDFDGAVTSYVNAELGVAIDNVTVEDSGFGDGEIALIVDALNGMFDDIAFTSVLPADGEFSTIYIGVTSAFDEYGAFLGLAETIDSGNQIRDDNAFVLLDSSASTELVVSVIAHETKHIVHGMEHGGEGLERFATYYYLDSGMSRVNAVIDIDDHLFVYRDCTVSSTTVNGGGLSVWEGVATNTTVNGGVMEVHGGVATGTTVNGGSLSVCGWGGVATGTTVSGGVMEVCGGTATSTTVSGGFIEVCDGGLATSTTLSGGVMSVFYGGMATSTTVIGGNMLVYDGGTATFTTVSGGSMSVFNGGVATSTTLSGGSMSVFNGGVATSTTLSGGVMSVFNGGMATSTNLNNGEMLVLNGGMATSTTVSLLGKMSVSGGTATSTGVINGGHMYVFGGGTVSSTNVNNGGFMSVFGGGTADSTKLIGGVMSVCSGGTATRTTVPQSYYYNGLISVFSGGTANDTVVNAYWGDQRGKITLSGGEANRTTLSGGNMFVSGGVANSTTVESGGVDGSVKGSLTVCSGMAKNTTVNGGGQLFISSGCTHGGSLQIADGGVVYAYSGVTIDFTVAEHKPRGSALVNRYDCISGETPAFTITVSGGEAYGRYALAGYASSFSSTITVKTTAGEQMGVLTVNGDDLVCKVLGYEKKLYSLAMDGDTLVLDIIDITPPDTPQIMLSGDAASRELIVTAVWDTDDAVCLYAVDGSDELREYDSPLRFGDDARVRFQTKDAAENTTDLSMDLLFGRATGKWTEGYRAWNPGGYDNTVELKGRNVIGGVFTGSDDSTILVLSDDDNGDALFLDDIYSAYPDGVSARSRLSKVNEIVAGAGNDVVDLTSPRFGYADGGVTVHGGLGDDVLWANSGVNRLFGDGGDDRIVGGNGDDVIVGGVGNDVMHGGGGDDIFCFCSGWGNDTVEQLATGKVTLWFADGDESKWDSAKCTYTDGDNSVVVTGVASTNITLKFGDDVGQYSELQAAGAFDALTSERIFEDKNALAVGILLR